MKAIFMTEIGGRLMEVERKEIKPTLVYYRPVVEPLRCEVLKMDSVPSSTIQKREVWRCRAKPITENDFSVFLLDCIE